MASKVIIQSVIPKDVDSHEENVVESNNLTWNDVVGMDQVTFEYIYQVFLDQAFIQSYRNYENQYLMKWLPKKRNVKTTPKQTDIQYLFNLKIGVWITYVTHDIWKIGIVFFIPFVGFRSLLHNCITHKEL